MLAPGMNPSTPDSRLTEASSPLNPSRNLRTSNIVLHCTVLYCSVLYLTVPSSSPPANTSKMSEISVVPPGSAIGAAEKYLVSERIFGEHKDILKQV